MKWLKNIAVGIAVLSFLILLPFLENEKTVAALNDQKVSNENLTASNIQLTTSVENLSRIRDKLLIDNQELLKKSLSAASNNIAAASVSAPNGIAIMNQSGGNNTVINEKEPLGEKFLNWGAAIEPDFAEQIKIHLRNNPGIEGFDMPMTLTAERYNRLLEILNNEKSNLITFDEKSNPGGNMAIGGVLQFRYLIIHIQVSVFSNTLLFNSVK